MKAVERKWVGALAASKWESVGSKLGDRVPEVVVWNHFWGPFGCEDGPLLIRYDNGQLCKFKRKPK